MNKRKVKRTETLTPKTGNREPQENYRLGKVSNTVKREIFASCNFRGISRLTVYREN